MSKSYNLKRQDKDHRDFIYKIDSSIKLKEHHFITDLPKSICPVLDQGQLGSCLANAIYAQIYILSNGKYQLSRLHTYMCIRALDGSSLSQDTGGSIRAGMKAIKNYGISPESFWPYNNITNNFSKLSPSISFVNRYPMKKFTYTFLPQDLNSLKNALISGNPILIGIAVYSSFETDNVNKYGTITYPDIKTETLLGGHALLIVGYDDKTSVFKVQNSWGLDWGDSGYGYIPYRYILDSNLTFDFCIISFNL